MKFALIVIASLTLLGCSQDEIKPVEDMTQSEVNETTVENIETPNLTLEKFESLTTGMTLEQVENALGVGKLDSSYEDEFGKFETYIWEQGYGTFEFSNIVVSFQNDELTAKSQFGL